mmetsp:Transcript_163/g.344  ORF Transcript_163/g.344 Transcript_163/m.344 type:complete len:2630 (+) Transcript_163:120-8009(+)
MLRLLIVGFCVAVALAATCTPTYFDDNPCPKPQSCNNTICNCTQVTVDPPQSCVSDCVADAQNYCNNVLHSTYSSSGGASCANNTNEAVCTRQCSEPKCTACIGGVSYGTAPNCQPCPACNNGSCDRDTGKCICNVGWQGSACSYSDSTTCSGKGSVSVDSNDVATCRCYTGHTGANCSACLSFYYNNSGDCMNCQCDKTAPGVKSCNNATGACVCRDNFDGPLCDRCKTGLYGTFCNISCTRSNCSDHGSCTNDGISCDCDSGWSGAKCDVCAPGFWGNSCTQCQCQNSATCFDTMSGNGTCSCTQGWAGQSCTDPIPYVTSISPSSLSTSGQMNITIYGGRMSNLKSVYFQQPQFVYGQNEKKIIITPPADGKQLVLQAFEGLPGPAVVILEDGASKNSTPASYSYNGPTIDYVAGMPLKDSDTLVTISGNNFGSQTLLLRTKPLKVKIGGNIAVVDYDKTSHTQLVVKMPKGQGTNVTLSLSVDHCSVCDSSFAVDFAKPTIEKISNPAGPTNGASRITLTGSNFGDLPTSLTVTVVKVAGGTCSDLKVENGTGISVQVPPGTGSNLPVSITVAGQTATKPQAFSYDAPTVSSITGCGGVCNPSDTITINGQNFGSSNIRVTVQLSGNNNCSNVQITVDHNQLTCKLPVALSVVDVAVVVSVDGVASLPVYGLLRMVGPLITSVGGTLAGVPTAGGRKVTIGGENFAQPVTIKYGAKMKDNTLSESLVFNCLVTSSTTQQLECNTATGVGQSLYFQVTSNGIASNIFTGQSLSYSPPTITASTLKLYDEPGSQPSTFQRGFLAQSELISFNGTNFGASRNHIIVTYGPPGPNGNQTEFQANVESVTDNEIRVRTVFGTSVSNLTFTVHTGVVLPNLAQARAESPQTIQIVTGTDEYAYPVIPTIQNVSGCGSDENPCDTQPDQNFRITITGTNFVYDSGVTARVGNAECTDVRSVSNCSSGYVCVDCLLPPGVGQGVTVQILTLDKNSLPHEMIVYKEPTIEYISGCASVSTSAELQGEGAKNCTKTGNINITLVGKDFGQNQPSVLVGGQNCETVQFDVQPSDKQRITCKLPAQVTYTSQAQVFLFQYGGRYSKSELFYQKCPKGTYTSGTVCIPCDKGLYSPNDDSSFCAKCPTGRYQNEQNQSECKPCQQGQEAVGPGQTSCTDCALGHFKSLTADSECTQCLPGSYSNLPGQSTCQLCPPGKFQNDTKTTTCIECDEGKFSDKQGSTRCQACAIGTYQDQKGKSQCSDCDSGKFQNLTGKTECKGCEAGRVSENQGSVLCEICSKGQTNTSEHKTCCLCPAGKYADQEGSSECKLCPEGKISARDGSVSCLSCAKGTYSSQNGTTKCESCRVGKSASEIGSTECTDCEAGKFARKPGSIACDPCEPGRSSNKSASSSCTDCDPGKSSNTAGQGGAKECALCPAGKFTEQVLSDKCEPCPLGKSNPNINSAKCDDCAAGKYSEIEGQTQCKQCEIGKFSNSIGKYSCDKCLAGQFANTSGLTGCFQCPVAKYQDQIAQSDCKKCEPGKISNIDGLSNCYDCPKGRFVKEEGQDKCEACTPGYVSPYKTASENDRTRCVGCEPGKYSPFNGTVECLNCPKGRYGNSENQSACNVCEAGTYQDKAGQKSCKGCVVGSYCPKEAFKAIVCAPGTYGNKWNLSKCELCPAGSEQPKSNQTSCVECKPGYFSETEGQSNCDECPPGRFINETNSIVCDLCGVGRQQNVSGGQDCNPCEPGRFSSAMGQSQCSNCESGTYINVTGATVCELCPKGEFTRDVSNTVCEPCPKGKSNGLRGRTECSVCSAGTFANTTSQTECYSCQKGKFQTSEGQQSCTPAEPGHWVPLESFDRQLRCPNGKYSNQPGQTECTLCPVGKAASQEASTKCDVCGNRTYALKAGSPSCLACVPPWIFNNSTTPCQLCPPGKQAAGDESCVDCELGKSGNGTDCYNCEPGQYAPQMGLSECLDCPPGAYSLLAASSCICQPQYYALLTNETKLQCQACSEKFDCSLPGLRQGNLTLKPGYWRGSILEEDPENIYDCLSTYCLGDGCAGGRTGPLCQLCLDNFVMSTTGECVKCEVSSGTTSKSVISLLFITLLVALFFAVLLVKDAYLLQYTQEERQEAAVGETEHRSQSTSTINSERSDVSQEVVADIMERRYTHTIFNDTRVQMKLLVVFFQVTTSLSLHINTNVLWPPTLRAIMDLTDIFNLDVLSDPSNQCVLSIGFYNKLVIYAALPFAIFVAVSLFYILPKKMFGSDSFGWCKVKKVFLFLFFLLYGQISSQAFSMFDCTPVAGETYLTKDFTLKCYDETWFRYLPAAITIICVVSLGLPLYFLFRLVRASKSDHLVHPIVVYELGFLYEAYKPKMFWFELSDMLYRLIVSSLLVFLPVGDNGTGKLQGALVLTVGYYLVIMFADPYKYQMNFQLHLLIQVEAALLSLAGQVLVTQGTDKSSGYDFLMTIFLLVVFLSVICLFLYNIRRTIIHIYVRCRTGDLPPQLRSKLCWKLDPDYQWRGCCRTQQEANVTVKGRMTAKSKAFKLLSKQFKGKSGNDGLGDLGDSVSVEDRRRLSQIKQQAITSVKGPKRPSTSKPSKPSKPSRPPPKRPGAPQDPSVENDHASISLAYSNVLS